MEKERSQGVSLSLSLSHSLGSGSGAEEAGIWELEFCELLVAVHLDNEWHSQDQEGGAGDPCRLASATEELLGHDGSFEGDALGVDDDGRLGYVAAGPGYEGMFAFLALGHSLVPLRRPTEQMENEIAISH
ncbi:hypothetical protein SO802_018858 [Lithocarpus litseifolius]|uniref:Uncharacterized protein n=1 Tax=Lithocarpus litseifolius TaxID=425828 RepID=A0AAW2CRQ7_9ROSI